MLTGAADFPLFVADAQSFGDEAPVVAALAPTAADEAALEDDFVGDGSAGNEPLAFPRFYFGDDQAEGEGSSSGGGGGACTGHTITVEDGSTAEGDTFLLSVSGSVSPQCLIVGYDIDWGDGNSGYYTALDTLAHTYEDDNPTATPQDDYTVSVVAYWDDDVSATDSATVTVSNIAPTAVDDAAETTANQPVTTVNVLANDTDPSPQDVLSIVSIDTSGTLGLVTDNGDGSFDYDPSGIFESLGDGDIWIDTFAYTIVDDDDNLETRTATVNITIAGVADAPMAIDDTYSAIPDTTLDVVAPGVLGNDMDPDSFLEAMVISGPSHGTLDFNSDGSFSYTPSAGYSGEDSFTYSASDGNLTDSATVTITVPPSEALVAISLESEVTEPETDQEPAYATFTITLINGSQSTTVDWETTLEDGDEASPDDDFGTLSGSVELSPENPSETIQIPVFYDEIAEDDETFHVVLTAATNNVTLAASAVKGKATIHNLGTGRYITGFASSGPVVWEGDSATFTATLNSPTPIPNETLVWQKREVLLITRSGETVYGDWAALPGAGGGTSATYTFSEPFIGQIRALLTSSGTVSSGVMDIRAKAAYPVDFHYTGHARVGNHMEVTYAWSSSSGRMADLDGVALGEWVWWTQDGYARALAGAAPEDYFLPRPFNTKMADPFVLALAEADVIAGVMTDAHGGVKVVAGGPKSATGRQAYWYQINDGFSYNEETDGAPRPHGDSVELKRFYQAIITYSIAPDGAGAWTFTIDKSQAGSIAMPVTSFPWIAN